MKISAVIETVELFRPVGLRELELIKESGFLRFPPRLPGQPFFYPVANIEYAREIARNWNTKDEGSGFQGHVLKFSVPADFLQRFQPQTVGASRHVEYWIPSGQLEEFNAALVGKIEVIESFTD